MKLKIEKNTKQLQNFVFWKGDDELKTLLNSKEVAYTNKKIREKNELIIIDKQNTLIFILALNKKTDVFSELENYRKNGTKVYQKLKEDRSKSIHISTSKKNNNFLLAFLEGLLLSAYDFNKYKKEKTSYLENISIHPNIEPAEVDEVFETCKAVSFARDLVNEPLSYLTAEQLGEEIKTSAKAYKYSAEVLGMKQIEALKMGGLLAVNKGSFDPPSFSILEWKPKNYTNEKPLVIVGKGVVFDTGGLSLKPTAGSMDQMKSDMAGAAAVVGAMQAIAANKLNKHVIALVPATDNRPGNNAYAPQDIVTMYDGTKVEVLNTDAEGRMLLADALSYAKKFDPELVIDLATLTGAAHAAVGEYATVAMGNAPKKWMSKLTVAGENVYERIVEFPFWDEYAELIKSDIGEIKNIGGPVGGAITAGKFLEHFTDYPYIHLDIAGPAYISANSAYRPKGGTGVGVRLLYEFIRNY